MDYIRIKSITEADFDQVVVAAGGSRIAKEGAADYVLNEAIIELKLVVEEGFEKRERQQKLTALFRQTQPNLPVVTIAPTRLSPEKLRSYYRIVEAPLKSACKKASKQLQATAACSTSTPVRVLVILNVGYTLLSSAEFREVCCKCVRNDTTGIDWVVCGGVYFHSDKFDNFMFAPFEAVPINLRCAFPSRDTLGKAWGVFVGRFMTDLIKNPNPAKDDRMPVLDLVFELDEVRYVKPAPRMPRSEFWPGGRQPRENTSGINSCPPVARTFPSLADHEWRRFKEAMPSASQLKATYVEWLKSRPVEPLDVADRLKPLVLVELNFEDFARWVKTPRSSWRFSDVGRFSSKVFHQRAVAIMRDAKDNEQTMIVPSDYILLVVNEIANDMANDYCSIAYVSEVPGFERSEPLVENAKIFFEHGMAVAASYAIKRKVGAVLYSRRQID